MTLRALDLQPFSFSSRSQKAERTQLREHRVPCARWSHSKVPPAHAIYCWDSPSPSLPCIPHRRFRSTPSCYEPPFSSKQPVPLVISSKLTVFKITVESEMGQLLPKCYSHLEDCSTRATIERAIFKLITLSKEMHMRLNSKQMKQLKDPTQLACA